MLDELYQRRVRHGGRPVLPEERVCTCMQTHGNAGGVRYVGDLHRLRKPAHPVQVRLNHISEQGGNLVDPTVGQLHALRIAFKRLRYTIEFFEDVLAEAAYARSIDLLKQIQDCLGDIHDTDAAISILRDFLAGMPDGSDPAVSRVVSDYLACRRTQLSELMDAYPKIWDEFISADFENQLLLVEI